MKDPILTLRVKCLSGTAEIEKECERRNLALSPESRGYLMRLTLQKLGAGTAQKLISKLVDSGSISWSETEDFEVEAIMDHCKDEDVSYYLIKWKGWNQKFNTWEPETNLLCDELIREFHEVNSGNGRKRKRSEMEDRSNIENKTNQDRIDDIYRKIVKNCQNLTPFQLLGVDRDTPASELKRFMDRGLLGNPQPDNAPHQFKKTSGTLSRKHTKTYKEMKAEVQLALRAWERHINKINTDPAPIVVQNDCDLEGPPANFTYISDYVAGDGIELPKDPLVGCECTDQDCFASKKSCCPANMGSDAPYNKRKKLRVNPGTPLYECNVRCKCDNTCPYRVVQLGRKSKLCIFRTSNSRGWGVKTLQKIAKGSFVMEYVGEVITSEEAEARGKIYDSEGMTYLFDLDFNEGDNPYTVDARNVGNVSHFVNHSCDPNLVVYGVWINNLDPSLPRIALFARRDIAKGEELTFDYMMKIDHQTTFSTEPQISSVTPSKDGSDLLTPSKDGSVTDPSSLEGVITPSKHQLDQNCLNGDCLDLESDDYLLMKNNNINNNNEVGLRSPVKPAMGIRTPAKSKNRIKCQCGAATCRGFLF